MRKDPQEGYQWIASRKIRDSLHDTIEISPLENLIIDHPYFQRLRRISQTAFLSYVFPASRHSRFEHSLGAMHLAGVAWEKLIENMESFYHAAEQHRSGDSVPLLPKDLFERIRLQSDTIVQKLRIAALLHDVGHTSFSHSGEIFLPLAKEIQKSPHLSSTISPYIMRLDPLKKVNHEVYSLRIADEILQWIEGQSTHDEQPFLLPTDLRQDVLALLKPDIGFGDGSILSVNGLGQTLHQLISGEFDVDRMDYLVRDSKGCGVVYGIFDATRLLEGLLIYEKDGHIGLALKEECIAAYEDFLRARHSMYHQVYFHKTSCAAEAMLQHLSKNLGNPSLPVEIRDYCQIDDTNLPYWLSNHAKGSEEIFAIINNLFKDRKLWKTIAQVKKYKSNLPPDTRDYDQAKLQLIAAGVPFEEISAKTIFSRLISKTAGQSHSYRILTKRTRRNYELVTFTEGSLELQGQGPHRGDFELLRIFAPVTIESSKED